MSVESLRRLAERADGVGGRQAERLDEVHARIRGARRQRAAGAAVAGAAIVAALAICTTVLVRSPDNAGVPLPQGSPTPSGTIDVPQGQTTVTAQIAPGDIGGFELRGSSANHDHQTDLSLVVRTRTLNDPMTPIVPFCKGTADTWWVITFDLDGTAGAAGVGEGQSNGTRGLWGRCSPDDSVAVGPPETDIDGYQSTNSPQDFPLRMFVTSEVPEDAQRCLARSDDANGCLAAYGLSRLSSTDATFGLSVYEYRHGPAVLDILGGATFEARTVVHGQEYLVNRAVVAAPSSERLVVDLPESSTPRLVELVARGTAATETCARAIDIEVVSPETERARAEAFHQQCVPTLVLRVDGDITSDQSGEEDGPRISLPAGPHLVTVDVVKNDPSNVEYALVVWEVPS